MGILVQQGFGRKDEAGDAIAALHRAVLDEGLLERVQRLAVAQALDGRNLAALGAQGGGQAGKHRLAVHDHRAGPAFALIAADFGAGQPQAVAEHVYQQLVGLDLDGHRLTVDGHGQRVGLGFHGWPPIRAYCGLGRRPVPGHGAAAPAAPPGDTLWRRGAGCCAVWPRSGPPPPPG